MVLPPSLWSTRERERKLDRAAEGQLILLAFSPAAEVHAQGTVQLQADRLVELQVVGGGSHRSGNGAGHSLAQPMQHPCALVLHHRERAHPPGIPVSTMPSRLQPRQCLRQDPQT